LIAERRSVSYSTTRLISPTFIDNPTAGVAYSLLVPLGVYCKILIIRRVGFIFRFHINRCPDSQAGPILAWSRTEHEYKDTNNRVVSRSCSLTPFIHGFHQFRYNHLGVAQAFGAEAYAIDSDEGESNGWKLARYFKLHLHPLDTIKTRGKIDLHPLPLPIDKIYADFFRYIYAHTQEFFKQREDQGSTIWQRLAQRNKIEFVIAHPNGWTGREQAFLRKAAVDGGLVSQSNAQEAVHMITEAEASVHFVMIDGAAGDNLKVW
jgi:hypothetical protein